MNISKGRARRARTWMAVWAGTGALLAAFTGTQVEAIGGLCNGVPASSTTLDASGQYGPGFLIGTEGNDVIIGTDGDDIIEGMGGDDVICGAAGFDHIFAGSGMDAVRGDTGDDYIDGGADVDTLVGDGGNDIVRGGTGADFLSGGSGDDVLIGSDDAEFDVLSNEHSGEDPFAEFDVCLFGAGDELHDCNY